MKVYKSLDDVKLADTAIAIGVFDGVHRGHQEVLHRTATAARGLTGGTSLALTFDRHPAEIVAPEHAPLYLSSLSQRIEMIERYTPTDIAVVIPFDSDFANLSAHDFVEKILVGQLGARLIFVGADFRYGKDRQGGVMDLQASGGRYGFDVRVIQSVAQEGERVSSTRIRTLVEAGRVAEAKELLGHAFTIRGKVVAGKKLGRTIGYPTANLNSEQTKQLLPLSGVYAAYANLPYGKFRRDIWPAAVSIGVNPTTDGENAIVKIEAYLMEGFSANLYDISLDIELIDLVRVEQKFDSVSELVNQIKRDVVQVKSILDREFS